MTRPQNSDGRPQFHLRRISHRTLSTAANNICFSNRITFVGRGDNVHYLVSSSAWPQRIFLSRRHCRLVRSAADDSHRLIDSSMTGVYVNDVKIAGSYVLEEGDVVTFGHPKGDTIKAGTRVRQPDSEHQFVFEACQCVAENPHQDVVQTGVHKRHKQLVGAAPTTPEMLGSFRVPKTVPKRKGQSPAVLTHGRPTQGGASSVGSSETTPPSSRRRPQTRSQDRHVTNPGSRSSTRSYTTQKDVGIQSGESSLESDTDTEMGFLDETRKSTVKGKLSEKDARNHVKDKHNGNPTLSAPVQSPARPTKSLGSKNPVKNDVDKEVSGIDTTEEHVEDHPLDLTLKFDQTGFGNKVNPQEIDQNGREFEVQTPDGKFISEENTDSNSKTAKQPEKGAQEPLNAQVTVDEQKEGLQQTAQFDNEGNVEEKHSKQSSQDKTDMNASAHQGQKDAESAKVVDDDPKVGTKAGADAMEDGYLPTPLAVSSTDAIEDMSGHSVQSTEEKSVLSQETEEETPDLHGLVEDTLSPRKIFEESPKSPKPVEDRSGQSQDKVLVEDDPCSVEGTGIADVQTDEQEIKDTFADKLTDVDVATMSPKPVEDSMVQSQDNVTVKDDHCGLEKKEIADVLTDEQAFEDKLTDVDVAAMSPKPVEDSIARSPVEDHLSLEKKEIADVPTDKQEIKDPFEDKLTDVDVTAMSPKPVEDSMVQSQDDVSVEDHLSLEKKEVADVSTDEQKKKDPFPDKRTDIHEDTPVKCPDPVENNIVQSHDNVSDESHHSVEKKKMALTDEQEMKGPFVERLTDEDGTAMSPMPVEDSSILVQAEDDHSIQTAEDEQDLSSTNPSNQTEEKDSSVKIDDLINDQYKNTTESQTEDKTMPTEGKVTDTTLTEPSVLEDEVQMSELLQSPKKPEPPCNKSAIDDTTVLQVEEDAPLTDGMEKEENDLEETNVSQTSQRTSTPSAEEKENNRMKDSSDHFVQSEPASVDDDDPTISRPSPIIEQLHEKSTLNIAPNDSTAWVLKEFEDLEGTPETLAISKTINTKDASQDLSQQSSDVPSSENKTEKEMIPSSQGSKRELDNDSGESSDSHMGILRLSPSGRNGDNSSQSQSDAENEDVETPLSQNSTYSDFGLSGVVPFVASPAESQEDSREALYSKVVAEIQANEENTAMPTHFGMQDQGSTRDNNGTTGLKKSVTWEVTDSCLDTDDKENDDPSRDDLDDNFSDRDSRFIISDSIDYRAEDDNYPSESESFSSDEEEPSSAPIEGVGLGLHMSDSEGEAEERRHSSQSVSQHKEHSSCHHQVKHQNKDVSDPQEESYEERKETKISDSHSEPTDNEDAPSGNLQDTSTQLTKTEEEKNKVLPLEEISPVDARLSQVLQTQVTGTGELQNMKEDKEDDVKVTESDPRVRTSGISMATNSSSTCTHKQQDQDRDNDSERDISNPHINQEEASNSSLEESRLKGQLNTGSEVESVNEKQLCADDVNTHNHVEEENTAIDDQPCSVGTEVMSSSKRLHDENDTVLPQNKRLHLGAQLVDTDNTEVEGFTSMDVASEGCENVAEDLPFATEDRFDMQCDVTEDVDTAPLKQMSLPLILVKSRSDCVRDVVLDFFAHRFFVNKMSSKLDKIAEDARKQKVADEVKTFFASEAWKEQPKTTPMEDSVEPVSETASDSNSSAKKRDDFTHKESSTLEVDKRKVIEHAVYEFFRKKNFAGRKKEDLGTEDTVGSETGNKVQTMPKKRRNREKQVLENAPEAKRPKLQEVSKELDGPSSEDTQKVHEITPQGPQQPDVCRESIGDTREEVNSSQTYISSSENQDCKTFADIQEDSKDYEVKANQDEQNQTLGRSQQDKNREEISYETSNTNDKDDKETDTFEEMIVAMERDISDKDGHKLETSTEEMDILVVEPEQHNEKEIMVDTQEVHMQVCMPTGSDSKVDEDEKNNCLSSVAVSAEENVKPLEERIEESPAQKEEVVPTKNLPQEDVLSDKTTLTASPRCQTTNTANNKLCDDMILDTASTGSPIEIKEVQRQDLAEADSKVDNEVLQSDLSAIEEASLEKPPSSLPSDNGTCPPSQSKELDQTSQEDVIPEVCNDIDIVEEDSGTDVNSDSSLPSPDGYSNSESDKDSDYSDNDRFLSSNSMEYGAEYYSEEDRDGSDQEDEDNDSSEDDDDDNDDDASSEEDDDDDDEDGCSSTPKSPPSINAEKTNIASKGCPDTEQNVEPSRAAMSGELDYANEVVIKETEKQSNEPARQGLSCDFDDDDDEFSAPHIDIDDIDFDDDNFDDDNIPPMETSSSLHSPVTSVGKDTPAQEKTKKAAVQASEVEKSKKVTNVALSEDNFGLGTSRESARDTVTRPQAFKSRNLSSEMDARDTTPGVGKDKENPGTQMTEETPGVLSTNAGRTRRRLVDTPGKVTTDNAPRYMEQCQTILASLQGALDREPSLKDISRVQAWKKEAAKLGEKMSLPETIIAVVGDTGAGKSSLMNALLDQSSVLPTSGMRACTAVVVEVSNNDRNKNYEAEVEFLSRKEWDDELRLLLTDLIGEDGKAKRKPDPQSEAGIAWSKIKAVYGRVESYDVLSKLPHVRHLLGTTKHISKSRAREFRSEIDRYVDSMDAPPARGPGSRDRSGGQLWPIVKRVKVQIPNCEVCSSGAILVDLPGVRDSNAARDNIAKQYFKNCNAIWIVASIHRAVDDKTAKELLGEGFRRQLLMDGQYGSIAFICTKTDDLRCSEIIRALNLEDEVEQLENEINALEVEKMSLTEELESLREEEEVTDEELAGIQQEVNDLKEGVFELEQTVEPLGDEEVIVDDEDREQLNSLRSILEEKQNTEQETKTSLNDIRSQIADKEKEMAGVERQVSRKQKQMSVMCAKARNQYSQTQIKADFKAGIREMKRKAGMMGEDADSDDDEEEEAGDQEEEDIARGLRVFTVSSTEYLKLTNKLTRDGPAQVFSNVNDTQIPALREFVHEMTNVRRQSGTEKQIRNLGSFISDIASYLLDEGTKNHGTRMSAKSIFEHHLGKLKTSLQPVLGTLQTDVDRSISICIHPKLKEGVAAAASMCQAVAKKWGAPTCKENRQAGGLHYSTYKATVRRSGVYKSPTYGPIDMNEDLSSPLYNTITISWQKVFDNGTLFFSLDNCKLSILSTLKEFLLKLRTELQALGMDADRVNRVGQQQLNSTKMRLDNAVAELKEFITGQQREISRVMTPAVQIRMEPAYETCANERGPGSFNRMRNHMDVHVAYEKDVMFDQASQFLLKQLADLEVDIVARMQVLCDQLCDDLAVLYEPFWEAPVHCTILKKHLMDDMLAIHGKVKTLFEEADLKDLPPLPEPAPQSAVSQSGPDINFSLMNTPGSSNMATGMRPTGSNPVTMVTPNQPFTLRMKQELVDNHSYGTHTPLTSQYGVRQLPPSAMNMTANVVTSRGLGPFSGGTHMPASMQPLQASTSTYTSMPHIKKEASPQIDNAGASTPLLNPTSVSQFRKRTLQGMTGPGNSQATTPPVLKKVKTEDGYFVAMVGQGGQVLRFPVVQTMTQVQQNSCTQQTGAAVSPFLHTCRTAATSVHASNQSLSTITGSYGGKTGKQPSANVASKNAPTAKSGKVSVSTYSTGKSFTSQGSSSAKSKGASSNSQIQRPSNGQTGLIGKSTTKKGGKGKGARGTPTTVPVARQQAGPALRVKQEPRSPLRENQSRKKRKFPPDEIIDLTLDD